MENIISEGIPQPFGPMTHFVIHTWSMYFVDLLEILETHAEQVLNFDSGPICAQPFPTA